MDDTGSRETDSRGSEVERSDAEGVDHGELRSRFWFLVVLFNFGPITFFVGAFLVAFEGLDVGYGVAAVGLLVTFAGFRVYRRTEARIDS